MPAVELPCLAATDGLLPSVNEDGDSNRNEVARVSVSANNIENYERQSEVSTTSGTFEPGGDDYTSTPLQEVKPSLFSTGKKSLVKGVKRRTFGFPSDCSPIHSKTSGSISPQAQDESSCDSAKVSGYGRPSFNSEGPRLNIPGRKLVSSETDRAQFDAAEGAGIELAGLLTSLRYSLRFNKRSVIVALVFALCCVVQIAAFSSVTIFLVGGLLAALLANTILFGVLFHTAEGFVHESIHFSFRPTRDKSSSWNDILRKCRVGVGATLASFGLFIILASISLYLISSSVDKENELIRQEVSQTPGTPYYTGVNTLNQGREVRSLLERNERDIGSMSGQSKIGSGAELVDRQPLRPDVQIAGVQPLPQLSGTGDPVNQLNESPTRRTLAFLQLPAPLVIADLLSLLWGLFCFPAACIVAVKSQSFAAAINPIDLLKTITNPGSGYSNVLGIFLTFCSLFIISIVLLTSTLSLINLPIVGNLPVQFLGSLLGFYFWTAFAFAVGSAAFKMRHPSQVQR